MIIAKLKWLDFARVQVTITDEAGKLIDQFTGENPDDALSRARKEYKITHIANHENYTHPNLSAFADIDTIVAEILQETEELRHEGLLAPFIEGTPIGIIPFQHRSDLKKKVRKNAKGKHRC